MMEIFQYAYFTFFTIGALIPVLFFSVLAYFFISIKNKSRSTLFFVRFLCVGIFFYLSYVVTAAFYHPLGAYHRWGTAVTVLICVVYMGLVILNFPDSRFLRFQKIYLSVWYAVCAAIAVYIFYETYHAEKIFYFSSHYWDFPADRPGKIYAVLLLIAIAMIMVMGVWRAVINRGVERWAALFM